MKASGEVAKIHVLLSGSTARGGACGMSVLQVVADKGATSAWCPVAGQRLLALGTKDGAGFDEYGGDLSVYSVDVQAAGRQEPQLRGKAET